MATSDEILKNILKVEGSEAAMAVGRDGLTLASAGRTNIDMEAIGAVSSSTLGAAEVLGGELDSGNLDQVLMTFEKGIVVLETLGRDVILVVFARSNANLGMLRLTIKKNKDALTKAFSF